MALDAANTKTCIDNGQSALITTPIDYTEINLTPASVSSIGVAGDDELIYLPHFPPVLNKFR
jgi:hypothetical protein